MSDPTPDPAPAAEPGPAMRTRLGPKWLGKTLIFLAVLFGFGCWGLYDATVVYPERGRSFAENRKWQYLLAADDAGMLSTAGVPDPAAAYARLKDPATLKRTRAAAEDPNSPTYARAKVDWHLYEWLGALETVGQLKPEQTRIDDPRTALRELDSVWKTRNQPKPLAKWDIPVQWLFVFVGYAGALWLAVLFLRVRSRSYGWDPAQQRLYLPDGSTLVPSDIEEFDKRRWDKFLIFLKVRPEHPRHGGRELKLDLYRYVPLEEWVLAMERTAFPEQAAAPAPEAQAVGAETETVGAEGRTTDGA